MGWACIASAVRIAGRAKSSKRRPMIERPWPALNLTAGLEHLRVPSRELQGGQREACPPLPAQQKRWARREARLCPLYKSESSIHARNPKSDGSNARRRLGVSVYAVLKRAVGNIQEPKRGNPMPLLANSTAVVTGAGSGIGPSIVSRCAREGARI